MSFIYFITKGFEDSLTCGCDTTDSVRYHLRANKIDLSLRGQGAEEHRQHWQRVDKANLQQ